MLWAHSAGMKTHVDYLAPDTTTADSNGLAESQQGSTSLGQSISVFPFGKKVVLRKMATEGEMSCKGKANPCFLNINICGALPDAIYQ